MNASKIEAKHAPDLDAAINRLGESALEWKRRALAAEQALREISGGMAKTPVPPMQNKQVYRFHRAQELAQRILNSAEA